MAASSRRQEGVKLQRQRRPDDISARPTLSLAKTASGLSLDRVVRPGVGLARTLGGGVKVGNSLLNMPKSTMASVRSNRQALDAAMEPKDGKSTAVRTEGVSCSTGTETMEETEKNVSLGLDIFGMRTGGSIDDGSDDFVDGHGDGDGGFWMPGVSLPTPPRMQEQKKQPPQTRGANEFFDGYNLWNEWESRKAGKPFWHCKETGETRWEKPTKSAVQEVLIHLGSVPCSIACSPQATSATDTSVCMCEHLSTYQPQKIIHVLYVRTYEHSIEHSCVCAHFNLYHPQKSLPPRNL